MMLPTARNVPVTKAHFRHEREDEATMSNKSGGAVFPLMSNTLKVVGFSPDSQIRKVRKGETPRGVGNFAFSLSVDLTLI